MSAASTQPKVEGAARITPGLDRFFAAVQDTNPFAANRVTEPSAYDVDVPAIHGDGFDRLVRLAGEALTARAGIGVALLGGAGVGKSHLLSRLYRWASEPSPGGGPRACYVYLHNILADPDRLPRYLLKYVVSRLSEGRPRTAVPDAALRLPRPGDPSGVRGGQSGGGTIGRRARGLSGLFRGVARRAGRLRGLVPVLPACPAGTGGRPEPADDWRPRPSPGSRAMRSTPTSPGRSASRSRPPSGHDPR